MQIYSPATASKTIECKHYPTSTKAIRSIFRGDLLTSLEPNCALLSAGRYGDTRNTGAEWTVQGLARTGGAKGPQVGRIRRSGVDRTMNWDLERKRTQVIPSGPFCTSGTKTKGKRNEPRTTALQLGRKTTEARSESLSTSRDDPAVIHDVLTLAQRGGASHGSRQ